MTDIDESLPVKEEEWTIVDAKEEPSYSEQEVVAEITSFYEFLVSMYLPRERVKYPPEGGWDIDQNGIWPPINDTVHSLLRKIPYLQTNDAVLDAPVIWEGTSPIDYSTDEVKCGQPKKAGLSSEYSYCPPEVVRLTRWVEDYGRVAYLDTERGTVAWVNDEDGPERQTRYGFRNYCQDPDEYAVSRPGGEGREKQHWREHTTYSVRDFFEMLKNELRTLAQTPLVYNIIFSRDQLNPKCGFWPLVMKAQEIYHKFGWPLARYQKDPCMDEVGQRWKEYRDGSRQRMAERRRKNIAKWKFQQLQLAQKVPPEV